MVFFFTTDGSATSSDPMDFTAVINEPVIFSPSTSSNEVTVTIVDDNIVENSEFFYGNVSTNDGAVNLGPSAAKVTISETEGDDSKFFNSLFLNSSSILLICPTSSDLYMRSICCLL